MLVGTCWSRSRGIITSAIRKITARPCRTIFAPIFSSRLRSIVNDHSAIFGGSSKVHGKLGRVLN